MSSKVLFSEEKYSNKTVGLVELKFEKGLNALDTEMYKSMRAKLDEWRENEEVAIVIIHSQVAKAFCAGGDVKYVVNCLKQDNTDAAIEFFTVEYGFDAYLRDYPKPVIGFAHGITMGGGLGLLQACDIRIASDQSLMSMPEMSIGFFCDVGASQFYSQLPGKLGLFLGLTAAKYTGRAAKKLKLVDYLFKLSEKPKVIAEILKLQYMGDKEKDLERITFALASISTEADHNSAIEQQMDLVEQLSEGSIEQIDEKYRKYFKDNGEDSWLGQCLKTYLQASPLSAVVNYNLLLEYSSENPKSALQQELKLATNYCQPGTVLNQEFKEGVRALLIDKDRNFSWAYKSVQDVESLSDFF